MSIAEHQRIIALEQALAGLKESAEKDRKLVNGLTQQCIDLAHVVDQLVKAQESKRNTMSLRNNPR